MKKIFLILMAVLVFSGCDFVSEIQTIKAEVQIVRLVGEWECTENGLTDSFIFWDNGNVRWTFDPETGSGTHLGTWSTDGKVMSLKFYGLELMDWEYTIDNDKLTISMWGFIYDYYKK